MKEECWIYFIRRINAEISFLRLRSVFANIEIFRDCGFFPPQLSNRDREVRRSKGEGEKDFASFRRGKRKRG